MDNGHKEVFSLDKLKAGCVDKPISSLDCLLPSTTQSTEVTPSESQKIASNFKVVTHTGSYMQWPKHWK